MNINCIFIAQKNFNISKATESEDLIILANNGILSRYGKTGKGTKSVLRRLKDAKKEKWNHKGVINGCYIGIINSKWLNGLIKG